MAAILTVYKGIEVNERIIHRASLKFHGDGTRTTAACLVVGVHPTHILARSQREHVNIAHAS